MATMQHVAEMPHAPFSRCTYHGLYIDRGLGTRPLRITRVGFDDTGPLNIGFGGSAYSFVHERDGFM
jgi:hypothetical protein